MDTTLLLVAAASLVALPLAGRLLVAVQQGWRPGGRWPGNRSAGGPSLRVVARVQLSPHHSLHLVETGGGVLLVSCSPKGTQVLDRHAPPRPSAAPGLAVGARAR